MVRRCFSILLRRRVSMSLLFAACVFSTARLHAQSLAWMCQQAGGFNCQIYDLDFSVCSGELSSCLSYAESDFAEWHADDTCTDWCENYYGSYMTSSDVTAQSWDEDPPGWYNIGITLDCWCAPIG